MSLGISHERLLPQRRLGLLRNSYPDHVIGSARNLHDVRQCCSAFARTLRTPTETRRIRRNPSCRDRPEERTLLVCKEKLEKLRRIRSDNALIMKPDCKGVEDVSSSSVFQQAQHPAYRLPSKPATAPPLGSRFSGYGTLAYKVYEDDAFVPLLDEKRLLGKPRSLPGRQFSFRSDEMGSSEFVTCRPGGVAKCYQISQEAEKQLFSCERRPWKTADKSVNPRNTYQRSRIHSEPVPVNKIPRRPYRSGSAPTLTYVDPSSARQDAAAVLSTVKNSNVNTKAKLQVTSRSAQQRRCSTLYLRAERPRTPPSVTTRVSSSSRGKGWLPFDEGPLGVVGEHFAPCKTRPGTAKYNNRTPLTDSKATAAKLPNPSVREITVVPSDVYQGPALSQPENHGIDTPPTNICQCKSVRFSCSENTVYEYKSNEPISL